jgi:hypothetical protein
VEEMALILLQSNNISAWLGGNQDSWKDTIEGSDSQGEGLRKILYQAYHMLKKVKYAQMLTR